jgi:hypothetical protein
MLSNKKKLNLLLFLAVCVFISIAATKPSANQNKHLSVNDTGYFKNLKVLPKDISKEKLDTIMHKFTASLGVRCNFCHAFSDGKPNFASDEKPEKDIARYMMHMTSEINTKYFNMNNSSQPDTISVVKCVTCHHGSPHPGEPNPTQQQGNMQPPPPPPNDSASKMAPSPNDSATKMAPPPQNQ